MKMVSMSMMLNDALQVSFSNHLLSVFWSVALTTNSHQQIKHVGLKQRITWIDWMFAQLLTFSFFLLMESLIDDNGVDTHDNKQHWTSFISHLLIFCVLKHGVNGKFASTS